MDILVMMLFVSLLLAFGFLAAFIWASRNKQFDDLTSPAWRAVFDEPQKEEDKDVQRESVADADKQQP